LTVPTAASTVGLPGRAAPVHDDQGPLLGAPAWSRLDAVLVVVLWAAAAAWFVWIVAGASTQGVLTGEEASITQRDGLALALGWQPSVWSTNAGGQLYFWVAAHLDPSFGPLYARKWKAAGTALLAPLLYLAARRRLGCGRAGALLAGVLGVVLPGVAVMAWLGIETPLDTVLGVTALVVVTSTRRWWPLGLVLAGMAVSVYTAALAWAAVVLLVGLMRVVTAGGRGPAPWSARLRAAGGVVLGTLGGLAVVLAPIAWWDNGGVVVTGGGRAGTDAAALPSHLGELAQYLVDSGSSYYYFADLPMLAGRVPALVLALVAALALARRPLASWPWAAALVAAAGLYAVSSGAPGARRVVALVVVLALLAGVGADVMARAVAGWWPFRGAAAVSSAMAVLLAIATAVPAASAVVSWRGELAHGTPALPIDWPFPLDPGETQDATLARLDDDLRSGRLTVAQVGDGWGGTRTLALLYMLDERTRRSPALTTAEIVDYYRGAPECIELDGPAGCHPRG
jgi:hypothetical protein